MWRHSIQCTQDLGGWGGSCTHCQLPATDSKHFVLCSLQKTSRTSCGIPMPHPNVPFAKNILSQFHLTKCYMPNCMENQDREPSFASLFPPQVPSSQEMQVLPWLYTMMFLKRKSERVAHFPHPIKSMKQPTSLKFGELWNRASWLYTSQYFSMLRILLNQS